MPAHLLPDSEFRKLIRMVISQREADIKSAVATLEEENKSLREQVAKLRGGGCWGDAGALTAAKLRSDGGEDVGQLPMAIAQLGSPPAPPALLPTTLECDRESPGPRAPATGTRTAGPEGALAVALPDMLHGRSKGPSHSTNKDSGEGGGRGFDHDVAQDIDESIEVCQQLPIRPGSLSEVAPASSITRPSHSVGRDSTRPIGAAGGDSIIHTGDRKRTCSTIFSAVSTRTSWQDDAVRPYSDRTGHNGGERSHQRRPTLSPPEEARPNGPTRVGLQSDLSDVGSEDSQGRTSATVTRGLRSFRGIANPSSWKIFDDGSWRSFCTRVWEGDVLLGQPKTEYSMTFRMLAAVIIWLDAACIGYQVDESLKLGYEQHASNDATLRVERPEHWQAIEVCFVCYYTLEILVRGLKERSAFLLGWDRRWNLFDSVCVISSIVCLTLAKDVSTKFLRLIRISKCLRVLRAVRFSGSLRAMVVSIFRSLMTLFWALCVMFLVLYFFTVIIVTEIADLFERTSVSDDSGPDVRVFLPYYKSLMDTTLHLFMSITGGIDWQTMAKPLLDVDPMLMLVFVMYICFMTFGVLNVVVGIFVAKAKENADRDRDLLTQAAQYQERDALRRMRDIFHEADKDGDNTLSWKEFSEYLADEKIAAFFRTLGLDVSVAKALFILLDVDDDDAVNIDEFVHGCNRLKGAARSIDVNMLLYQGQKLQHQILNRMDAVDRELTRLTDAHDLPRCEVGTRKVRASVRKARVAMESLSHVAEAEVTTKEVRAVRALREESAPAEQ